jgi:mannose-1-phosphate guanylyltransferase/mannose-1-phosphate guanylyltransferase/mannose-6-phosphate isomerase
MNDAASRPIVPVILSGGSGTRLWPLSRTARPKQMLDLLGGGSMLEATAARVTDPALFAPLLLVAGEGQADAIEAALPHGGTLILVPAAKNTAPAIALAALAMEPDDVLLVLPSDHMISDAAGFRDAARIALPFAEAGWIVTFGMKAERPETGYGYIERGPALGPGVHQALRFVEKPDAAPAPRGGGGGGDDGHCGLVLMRAGPEIDPRVPPAPGRPRAARGTPPR